ncbi:ABC transporter ATP-binding protein [Actinomycetospora termitidis]|uniref:ABC transporter ATP-binding protein n=1 Tax=Actinomycetospora termitidis TaxID=3053470 RepID=A0ABT7M6Y7_9PSEU|nr:ABC transporter ATP-binding protein [Actinomycetospora sp. Odt1-22]MDL5156424.1 ABC transporter ATP-binding protein [Actinomycetospora sp. Odt1-22]
MTAATTAPAVGKESLPDAGAAPAARVRNLRKTFGNVVAVDGVDLDIPAGSVLGMLGPNGSGKTTLIRMLLGLTRPTAGRVELLGRDHDLAAALPDVGALVEGPGFHPFLSGRDNLLRAAATEPRLDGDPRGPVDAALERVGLADAARRRYRGYSLGMKQRLGLAAALLVPRRLVVLDEPTNGLDPAGTRDVRRVVAELHEAGTTVLLSSHLLAEVEAVCSHVAVLQHGSLLVSGELSSLLEAGAGELVVTTDDPAAGVVALRAAGAGAYHRDGGVVVPAGTLSPPEVVAALVRAEVGVWEVRRDRAHLEELFARLTEEDA